MPDLFQPVPSYHFSVVFEMPGLPQNDFRFQKVKGLDAQIDLTAIEQGGSSSHPYYKAGRTTFSDLVLTRGLSVGSFLYEWCKDAILELDIKPCNLIITLLNEEQAPLTGWRVIGAVPYKWSISELDAEKSGFVIESITCKYRYFKPIRI